MSTLERRLGVPSAILIGLSSMIGAGAFFVWAGAAQPVSTGSTSGLAGPASRFRRNEARGNGSRRRNRLAGGSIR